MNDVAARRTTDWARLLDRLWRILAWPRLTIILLVWVAVILMLSAVIPQAPPHIEDPVVRSQWLSRAPINARPVIERLQAFGIFNLLSSAWLRLPLVLLLAHALVILADWSPAIWYRVRQSWYLFSGKPVVSIPRVRWGWTLCSWLGRPRGGPRSDDRTSDGASQPARGEQGGQTLGELENQSPGEVSSLGRSFRFERDWSESVEQVTQKLIGRLGEAGYRIWGPRGKYTSDQGEAGFIAWRWRWSWWGLAGIYLGLGLASAGLILAGWLGQVQEVNLAPDDPTSLPLVGAPNLVLDDVTVTGDDPMRPAAGVASMRLLTGVGESQRLTLRLHGSRLFQGTWLTLTALRPVAEVTAVDVETGENVLLQPFSPRALAQERVRLPLTGDPEMRFVGVPSQNSTLRVDYQANAEYLRSPHEAKGEDQHLRPAFFLSFFRGAEVDPSQSEPLDDGDEVTFDGVRYRVAFDYDALLRSNSTLWWAVVAIGWGMTGLSFILLVVAPPVYVQGHVEAAGEGSRVMLAGDALGNEESLRRELRSIIIPDA
jgi:hypothetical protein